MHRELRTRHEIHAEVHRLVHLDPQVIQDQVQIGIPLPVETDPIDGCNWAMSGYINADKHMDALNRALHAVMEKWNLRC